MKANLSGSQLITSMRSHGFALIEFIAVLAIMAIMAGAVAPLLINNIDRSEAEKERLALEAIGEGIRQYYLEHGPNMGRLPQDIYDAGGALTDTWAGLIEGNYVGLMETNILTNSRGNTRGYYYVSSGDFSVIPSLTLYSHIDVDENAPASLDYSGGGSCAGRAGEYVDPCDSATAIDFNLRILNINLGKERQQIIDQVKSRYLAPVAAAFERLPYDVCSGIADTDSVANEYYIIDGTPSGLAQGLDASVQADLQSFTDTSATDPWGQNIRVTKFADNLYIWSGGPFARDPNITADPTSPWLPAAYPLIVAARCQGGPSLDETFVRIKDAVIGYAAGIYDKASQPYVYLPANIQAAIGFTATDIKDSWGNSITYSPDSAVGAPGDRLGGGFVLTSLGPDTADNGDDIGFVVTEEEIRGRLAEVGVPYPGVREHLDRVKKAVIGYTLSAADYLLPAGQPEFEAAVNPASGTVIADPVSGNLCYRAHDVKPLSGPDFVSESFDLWAEYSGIGCASYPGFESVSAAESQIAAAFASAGKTFPTPVSTSCSFAQTVLDSTTCVDDWENNATHCEDHLKIYRKCP